MEASFVPATADSEYVRFVKQLGLDVLDENTEIRERLIRYWYFLTYPTGTLPDQPWERAREHVERYVADAPPWAGPGLRTKAEGAVSAKAIVPLGNIWVEYGPRPLDSTGTTNNAFQYSIVSGRLNVIVSDPTNRGAGKGDRAWLGFASGGLWRVDGLRSVTCSAGSCNVSGVTAAPMWDDKNLTTQAVSAIEIDPSDSTGNTVYVGTGDFPANDQFSAGIMKTTDGGANWTQLAAGVFTPFSKVLPPDAANGGCGTCQGNRFSNQNVKALEVDPNNATTLLAGTRNELYISHDAGSTWQICSFGNFQTNPEKTIGPWNGINRISSIYLDPRGGTTRAYVAVGLITKTDIDANGTFDNANNGVYSFVVPASGCPSWPPGPPGAFTTHFDGLPAGTGTTAAGTNTGRIELSGVVAADGRLTLYAQIENADTASLSALGTWVVRPDDPAWTDANANGVKDWRQIANPGSYVDCNGSASSGTGQDWYDLYVNVHPTDDKLLYIGHVDLYKGTVNAGYTTLTLGSAANLTNVYGTGPPSACPSYGKVHPDQHGFDFVELDPVADAAIFGKWILVGNDGGIYLNVNAGAVDSWARVSAVGISANQFYAGQVGQNFAGTDFNSDTILQPNEYGNSLDNKQWLLGGMQDDGCASWDSSQSSLLWIARGRGGDGMWTAFDSLGGTLSGGYWVVESQNGGVACSSTGADGPFSACAPGFAGSGESQDWSTPIVMDQFHCTDVRCSNLLVAGDRVYASTAYGTPSYTQAGSTILPGTAAAGSIVSLAVYGGPLTAGNSAGTVTAGTDNGRWWRSQNVFNCSGTVNTNTWSCAATATLSVVWTEITAAANQQVGSDPFPNRVVAGVGVDPTNDDVVYAALAGFGSNTPTAPGHIYRATWNGSQFLLKDKTGNLPDVPFQTVAANPRNPNQVFAGSYWGFFYTDDITQASPTWLRYMEGPLPNAPIYHFSLDRGPQSSPFLSTALVAFTYGRGAYGVRLPLTGETFCSNKPAAPTGVGASTPIANQVDLGWNDSATAGVSLYRVYRATVSGGPYTLVGTVPDTSPGVGSSGTYSFQDTSVSAGTTYYYVVRAVATGCESLDSSQVSAVPLGSCSLPPTFAGLQTATPLSGGQGCGVRLAWTAATSNCPQGSMAYNVYRSTSSVFTPSAANRIAGCVVATSYDDTSAVAGTTYYYVVRAEDGKSVGSGPCGGGAEETNVVTRAGAAGVTTLLSENFDSTPVGSFPAGWLTGAFSGGNSWIGARACSTAPQSAPNVLRYGGTASCAANYANSTNGVAFPSVVVPAGSTNVQLSFVHRWTFAAGDGGLLYLSNNGTNFFYIGNTYLSGQTYNSTANGLAAFGGTLAVPGPTTVNLSQFCTDNTVNGFTAGCAGQTIHVGFNGFTTVSGTNIGWFVDDVQVTQGTSCNAAPQAVSFLTATGKDSQVTAQWVNPGTYTGPTRVCRNTSAFAADPGAIACPSPVDEPGSAATADTATFTSLANGSTQYFAAFVNNGSGVYSARRTTNGYPIDTSGPLEWNFATQAATLGTPVAFPGLGLFAAGNDRALHQMQAGPTGGSWPSGWIPPATNDPVQGQPFSLTAAFSGGLGNIVLVSSQDGRVYCFNAGTGAQLWSSADFGVLQARPMVLLRAAGYSGAKDLVVVGTRNAGAGNQVVALDLATGATQWTYAGGAGGGDGTLGIISGPVAARPSLSRVYVTSRRRNAGSANTLWALDVTDSAATFAWGLALGDIDGSPTFHADTGNVLVGTNAGSVYNVTAAGAIAGSRALGDGPVKDTVWHDPVRDRIYVATTGTVWAIPDTPTMAGTAWTQAANAPTRPVQQFGTARVYVGACAASCADGRLYELDGSSGTGWTTKTFDLPGVGGLGGVVIDRAPEPDLLHSGSRSGRVVAVTVPLP